MKTPRFELKDFRLNEILSMLTLYSGPSLSEELNRVWTGEARTVKFGNRFSVDLTPEDVKENPEFRPNEWNQTKSWNIPKNVDLMFSIQEKESGKEIARLRGHFDGENFRRPSGEPMYAFCRGFHPENRGIYTQSDSSKKSSRNIWSLAVVSVDQRY